MELSCRALVHSTKNICQCMPTPVLSMSVEGKKAVSDQASGLASV